MSGRSKEFLASLMPQSPLYVPLLPEAAQRAIGQLHPDGALPFAILQAEGFDGERYIDILDGGPTMEATLAEAREHGEVRFLGDCTDLLGGHSVGSLYELAECLAEQGVR